MSAISDERVLADKLDLEMLERPHLWPALRNQMRCVFLRRPPGGAQTGPCFESPAGGYVVMEFDWRGPSPLKPRPRFYPDAAAVLADGWLVD